MVGEARKETFEKLLAFTDLERFTTRLAGALSGGMKQKLGLACAMLRSPRLLLLDEPSVGVDPISRRELWRMVYQLIDEGVGVVWSTAYLDEAENCAEVIVLNDGRALFQGDPKAMTAQVAGRVFSVQRRRRRAARGAGTRAEPPEVIDGVMQGEAVRLVMAEGAEPPAPAEIADARRREIVAGAAALRGRVRRRCSAASRSATLASSPRASERRRRAAGQRAAD